jgi:hypothetical protein
VTVACLALALLAASGCRTAPLVDPPPTAAGPTPEQTRIAVLRALATKRFVVDEESPGRIRARLQKNSWSLVVEVLYGKDVSMHYADSVNLRYKVENDVAYIHRNYNGFVRELQDEIQRQLIVEAREDAARSGAQPAPLPAATATH